MIDRILGIFGRSEGNRRPPTVRIPDTSEFVETLPPPEVQEVSRPEVEAVRAQHVAMPDDAWKKRLVHDASLTVEAPEGYQFYASLAQELATIPPEGMKHARGDDAPPPPLEFEAGLPVIPEHVYVGGVRWEVGAQVARGGFGTVHEIKHAGDPSQRPRLVKFMYVADDDAYRAALWNEVGAAMLTGDLVGTEVVQEKGGTWAALILERYAGETAMQRLERQEGSEAAELHGGAKESFHIAMMLRSVVHTLRRMHAAGWVHGDVKPGNIILNTTPGEESLSRLIDFGIAQRKGVIRQGEPEGTITGTVAFLAPESFWQQDIDLRIRDYWGAMVTAGLVMRLLREPSPRPPCIPLQGRLSLGTYYEAPFLERPVDAKAFFAMHGLSPAQQDFFTWIYRFIRPHDAKKARQRMWLESGITAPVVVEELPAGIWEALESDERELTAGFIDDDRFVRELEDHIRALAQEAGLGDISQALALLQEFPAP